MTTPTLRDLITLADVETVVRLDGRGGHLDELVLTGDVTRSLTAVLEAAGAGDAGGAAFFVVGPFGSGKSHFLAALGELLADPQAAAPAGVPAPAGAAAESAAGAGAVGTPPGWTPALAGAAGAARRSATVAVPLVEYRAQAALEDVVLQRAWRSLGQSPPAASVERATAWNAFLDAALTAPAQGVVLLLDELSEFLRAKQGPALTEDLRFLQFLGEWTRDHPVVVVAALQESIEEVANVSQRELTRIRDRFRPALTLSMRHVEDLVHGRLVRLKPDAGPWVERAWQETATAFPDADLRWERFARCYPLHPDTLGLLEGLRFLLSQQRGVVDFISRRLQQTLDRGYSQLITADELFDHFRERLHERAETSRLADVVVPYYERAAAELVDDEDRELALRAVKLLCLLAASPLERPRSAAELAAMLLVRASALDPTANAAYLERGVLAPIAARGAYVVGKGDPVVQYRVVLDADAAVVARALSEQAGNELTPGDRRMVNTLVRLGETAQLPLLLLGEVGWTRRELMWENTPRALTVGVVRFVELDSKEAGEAVERARSSGAEGCLLIGEVELDAAADARRAASAAVAATPRLAAWVPDALRPEEQAALRDIHSRQLALAQATAGGRADVAEVLEASAAGDQAVAREILRRAYFHGLACYGGEESVDLASLAGLAFDRVLTTLADPLLRGLHPGHRELMPRGELVAERTVRDLLNEVVVPGRVGAAALARGQLRALVQGYLVPLGLARVRSDGAVVSPDPAHSAAVAEVVRLVGDGPGVAAPDVVSALAEGPLGLTGHESMLVLNACVQAGLVAMHRGRRPFSEPFLVVTPSDRLSGGELVESSVRAAVAAMGAITGPGPFDPWTAATQRDAWDRAKRWLAARREDVGEVRAGLLRLADVAVLASAEPAPVLEDADRLEVVLDAWPLDEVAPSGLRRLAAAVTDPSALAAAAHRISAVARFLRDDLRRAEDAAMYLSHPDLVVPPSEEGLAARREVALDHLRSALRLAGEDRTGDVFQAYREFRGAYRAAYQEAHDRYYGAVSPGEVERLRSHPAYRALASLSAAGATSARDDIARVDRLIHGAAPAPCRARVDVALQWKPRCTCGFALGDREPSLDAAAVVAVARRGVDQHLAELARPDARERLAEGVADLQSLGRSELARDLSRLVELARLAGGTVAETAGAGEAAADEVGIAAAGGVAAAGEVAVGEAGEVAARGVAADEPGEGELAEVAALLRPGAELPMVLRDLLTRGQLIVTRDLAALRDDVVGRRYTKRRLLEVIAGWIDPAGHLPGAGYVEVVDSHAAQGSSAPDGAPAPYEQTSLAMPGSRGGGGAAPGPTVELVSARYPSLAARLPANDAGDAFWLAAWWAGRPGPPSWLPARLVAERALLASAAEAARSDAASLAELAALDRRIGPESALGERMALSLNLPHLSAKEVAAVLVEERLFSHPVRLAADQYLRRLALDWQLASTVDDADLGNHPLVDEAALASLRHLLAASRNLAALEQAIAESSCQALVEEIYPQWYAPVREQIGRARLAAAGPGPGVVDSDAIDAFEAAAGRLLHAADQAFAGYSSGGYAGCLPAWKIGTEVVAPLLATHGRVAVLLVDAMRADLAAHIGDLISGALPGRAVARRWVVTPAPTRTAEAVAALHLGRPVAGGSVEVRPEPGYVPFTHLGHEARSLLRADRDDQTDNLRTLLASGPPISVAVVTGIDERLHHSTVELAALIDESVAALRRRVVPALAALPETVPLLLLADHGFRENPRWGHGPEGRYVHGGTSLEECVTPVLVFAPRS